MTEHRILLCLASALVVLQLWPFAHPYLLTADDTLFQYWALTRSPAEWLAVGFNTATWKSKLGELLSVPLMIFGNWGIESLAVRLLNLGFFITSFALFAAHVVRYVPARTAFLVFLIGTAFLPLRDFHLPPTSYPFFPSVQLILGLLCLRGLAEGPTLRVISALGLFIALCSSEYTLFLLGALIAFEGIVHLSRLGLPGALCRPASLVGFAALACHLGWRMASGNGDYTQISGFEDLSGVLRVQLFHTLNGLIFGSTVLTGNVTSLPFWDLLRSILAGVLAALAVVMVLRRTPALQTSGFGQLLGLSVLVIFFVTFPVGLLVKYRDWCHNLEVCTYLDSRYAGWGLALAIAGFVAYLNRGTALRYACAICVGGLTILTALHNGAVSRELQLRQLPWRAAEVAVCAGPSAWAEYVGSDLAQSIRFHVHPVENRTRDSYWMAWAAAQTCG